jgi:hypothetical protein
MESDGIITKGRFSYVGEILPNNERSNAIIAQRREEEQRRKEEAERVSIECSFPNHPISFHKMVLTV